MTGVKEKLKAIATRQIRRDGVRGVSFRELGKAVGIKSSSVVYHFQNKSGLIQELARDYRDLFVHRLEEIDAVAVDPADRLQGLVAVFTESLDQDQFCFCGMLASDFDQLDEASREWARNFFKLLEDWAARVIATDSRYDVRQARELAMVFISGLEGALLLDRTEARPIRLRAMTHWAASLFT